MYTISFTLKQHTPIIHFQHDQEGATLRASEVKPKLDEYLIEKYDLTEVVVENGKTLVKPKAGAKKYFINNGKNSLALDYKLAVKGLDPQKCFELTPIIMDKGLPKRNRQNKILVRKFPVFFGNDGKENITEIKKGIIQNVQLVLIIKNEDLQKLLKNNIESFIANTNFGLSQSKGFGSFCTGDFVPNHLFFDLELEEFEYKTVFNNIETFHKAIRSGLNIKTKQDPKDKSSPLIDKAYYKSLMFQYAKSKNEQWDKRTMRDHFFADHHKYKKQNGASPNGIIENRQISETVQTNIEKPDDRNYFNYRDLLGLSTEQNWGYYSKNISKILSDIDRFKSPITYKPVFQNKKWRVYLITSIIKTQYLGATTTVQAQGKEDLLLDFPLDFEINDYLKFCVSNFNIDDFDYSNGFSYATTSEAQILDNIFIQLKKQIPNA